MVNRTSGYNITLQLHKDLKGHTYTYNSADPPTYSLFNAIKPKSRPVIQKGVVQRYERSPSPEVNTT
jgi:hypothetical protein